MHKLLRCLVSLALVFSLSCVSLTASAVDSSVYMPTGYGTKVWFPPMSVAFYDSSSKIGSASLTSGVTGAWQRLTQVDTAQKIYRLSMATWSGNVPAGTVGFKVVRDDSSYLPYVTFESDGWSGSDGLLSGSVTAYIGYGSSHSNYTKAVYPKEAELYLWYDGATESVSAGRVNTADGRATFSVNVDRPVTKIRIQFRWPDKELPNEFPSPSVCWGLTYIDDLQWSKTGVTTGQQTVSGIQESNNLLTGLLSGVNNVFQDFGDIAIFPTEYFCPINGGTKEIEFLSENTYSKHLYFASWVPKPSLWRRFISSIKLLLKKIIGKDNYEKLKEKLKGEQNG